MSLNAGAIEIDVGDRQIDLPVPEGYVELTPAMSPYYETMRAYISPRNVRYLMLVDASWADALSRGQAGDLVRFMNVETAKKISALSISSADFGEIRSDIRDQNDETFSEVKRQLPEILDKGNAKVSEELNTKVVAKVGGFVPLPVHLDSDDAIAYSMYVTAGGSVNGQDLNNTVLAATALVLHVKDKVLFLYVYAPEPELEATRALSAGWARDIVAANPLSGDEKRAVRRIGGGIDWQQVAKNALIGGVIGGLMGLLGRVVIKHKKP